MRRNILRKKFADAVIDRPIKYQIGVRGNKNGPDWQVIDMYDTSDLVDFNYDLQCLPIEDNYVDCYVCNAILEHVPQPELAIYEMFRTLKPGGMIWVEVPFTQPFHAHPYDYSRVTVPGIRRWMKNFEEVAVGTIGNLGSELRKYSTMLLSYTNDKLVDKTVIDDAVNSIEELDVDTDSFGKFYSAVYFWGKKPIVEKLSNVEKDYYTFLKSFRYPDILELGNSINFTICGFPSAFLGEGWANPEVTGCWTVGKKACLHFHLKTLNDCKIRLTIEGETYPGRLGKECLIDIGINGLQYSNLRFESDTNYTFDTIFESSLLKEDGELMISFDINNPLSPSLQGRSSDSRQLGLLIKKIKLVEE